MLETMPDLQRMLAPDIKCSSVILLSHLSSRPFYSTTYICEAFGEWESMGHLGRWRTRRSYLLTWQNWLCELYKNMTWSNENNSKILILRTMQLLIKRRHATCTTCSNLPYRVRTKYATPHTCFAIFSEWPTLMFEICAGSPLRSCSPLRSGSTLR